MKEGNVLRIVRRASFRPHTYVLRIVSSDNLRLSGASNFESREELEEAVRDALKHPTLVEEPNGVLRPAQKRWVSISDQGTVSIDWMDDRDAHVQVRWQGTNSHSLLPREVFRALFKEVEE